MNRMQKQKMGIGFFFFSPFKMENSRKILGRENSPTTPRRHANCLLIDLSTKEPTLQIRSLRLLRRPLFFFFGLSFNCSAKDYGILTIFSAYQISAN